MKRETWNLKHFLGGPFGRVQGRPFEKTQDMLFSTLPIIGFDHPGPPV